MNIQYYKRNVYGNETLFVKDHELSMTIRLLTGKASLTSNVVEALKKLGFTFEQVLN